jgi:Transcriptional regulators of sugar metabolism
VGYGFFYAKLHLDVQKSLFFIPLLKGVDAMNPKQRRELLLYLLRLYGEITISRLADILHTSPRTVRSDLDKLGEHYPIERRKGRHGSVRFITKEEAL